MRRITLKPSLLVAVSISRGGGVKYLREELQPPEQVPDKHEIKVWKTTKDVLDAEEFKKADRVAGECRRRIAEICTRRAFGWMTPKSREKELEAAWEEVKERLAETNAELKTCTLVGTCVKGEIVTDDQAAADAILQDIGAFFKDLLTAIEACDAKRIRATVATMKGLDQLLEPTQSEALQTAIKTAKSLATTITKEVDQKGKEISVVVKTLDLSPIDAAMVYFLETNAPVETGAGQVVPGAEQLAEVEHPAG
jgi:hypothetical protein